MWWIEECDLKKAFGTAVQAALYIVDAASEPEIYLG